MKYIFVSFIAVVFLSCNQDTTKNRTEKQDSSAEMKADEHFDWLTGNWKRLNEGEGKETFEKWEKISAAEYAGIGFIMQKGDTINQETMKLLGANGKWSLFVKTPDEKAPIEFSMTTMGSREFVCVNDSLDFPNRIHYWLEGEKLKAKVSNEEMNIHFEFEKIR